jgi:general secretion pathway protein A
MYLSYYHLTHEPFMTSTDPKLFWETKRYVKALTLLEYGILANKGILLLTGEAGIGKTTLVNVLRQNLPQHVIVVSIPHPFRDRVDFFKSLAHGLGMKRGFISKGAFLLHLQDFLLQAHQQTRRVVLIIDEAQQLDPELLEEVRLLSNIELPETKLLNTLLIGPPEFRHQLGRAQHRPLAQRIAIACRLSPLTLEETRHYITHRLSAAGGRPDLFRDAAIKAVFNYTKGNPRRINSICDLALMSGYIKQTAHIKAGTIKECYHQSVSSAEHTSPLIPITALRATPESSEAQGASPEDKSHRYGFS